MSIRPVTAVHDWRPTIEGPASGSAGPSGSAPRRSTTCFCCSTISGTTTPNAPGFSWHPHRGIETISYVISGSVEHGDSQGNRGSLGAGDVQWMTAGSRILHQGMPQGDERGRMHGFQLWANLPRALKMTQPRYQGASSRRTFRS